MHAYVIVYSFIFIYLFIYLYMYIYLRLPKSALKQVDRQEPGSWSFSAKYLVSDHKTGFFTITCFLT